MSFERIGQRAIRHVRPVLQREATGLVARVYEQAAREFQLAPPLTVHSPSPRLLAALWSATRETLIVGEGRVVKEAIAAAVSAANTCPFCVDVHSVMLEAGNQRDVAVALASGRADSVKDPELRAIIRWCLTTPRPTSGEEGAPPPIPRQSTAAYLGTAVVFHYINRVVNVFLRESSPLALPSGLGWLRGGLASVAARTIGRATIEKTALPGASLELLSDLDGMSGIAWIDEDPTIGPSLSRLFAAARHGGSRSLSPESLAAFDAALCAWHGEDPPIGRGWLSEALVGVRPEDTPTARLALLTARSSYQVTAEDVAAFRVQESSDRALVEIVAFGAAAAAQRIATRLIPGDAP